MENSLKPFQHKLWCHQAHVEVYRTEYKKTFAFWCSWWESRGWHLQGMWLKDGLVSFECTVDSFGSYKFKVDGPWSGLPKTRSEQNGCLFVVCYLILLGFVRSKFQCVLKCIWRCQDQFQDVLEQISDCYESPLTYWAIRSPHTSPHLCWLLKLEWLTNFEHVFQSLKKKCLHGVRS